ncbi:hypothetical protein THMIRHAS_10460 [Thiosulfatimonas sediminis]|uniref:Uncharacterized protein n=1 Tax=Thiosulfatimonas sediminis TaxID=2675054 RepID=A0A6F8PU55_9GAMM|nr:cell division protein ZapA [Thiosulfatimonas sediminis]BBP45673.1 hypothetical protein THMIRHAS_10460 [Thiosulfatimonas sediminis]
MIEINMMGHRFKFQCEDDERTRLVEAANMVETQMLKLPKESRNERNLLMVSINIAYELLQLKDEAYHNASDMKAKIDAIHAILTNAIEQQTQQSSTETSVN